MYVLKTQDSLQRVEKATLQWKNLANAASAGAPGELGGTGAFSTTYTWSEERKAVKRGEDSNRKSVRKRLRTNYISNGLAGPEGDKDGVGAAQTQTVPAGPTFPCPAC